MNLGVFFQRDTFETVCALVYKAVQLPRALLCPNQILPTEKACCYSQSLLREPGLDLVGDKLPMGVI